MYCVRSEVCKGTGGTGDTVLAKVWNQVWNVWGAEVKEERRLTGRRCDTC